MQGDLELLTGFIKLTLTGDFGADRGSIWVRRSAITSVEPKQLLDGGVAYTVSGAMLPLITVIENPLELMAAGM